MREDFRTQLHQTAPTACLRWWQATEEDQSCVLGKRETEAGATAQDEQGLSLCTAGLGSAQLLIRFQLL